MGTMLNTVFTVLISTSLTIIFGSFAVREFIRMTREAFGQRQEESSTTEK